MKIFAANLQNKMLAASALLVMILSGGVVFFSSHRQPSTETLIYKTNDLEGPQQVSYGTIDQVVQNSVRLWFKPENIKTYNGRLVEWKDAGPAHLTLKPSFNEGQLSVEKKAGEKIQGVSFEAGLFLKSENISRISVLKSSERIAILTVFKDLKNTKKGSLMDLFGWGDCKNDRYLIHLNNNGSTDFHIGPIDNRIEGRPSPEFQNQLTLGVFIKDQAVMTTAVNGFMNGQRQTKSTFSPDSKYSFMLGSSECGNHFAGQIYEFLLLEFEDPIEVQNAARHLINKYSLDIN